MPLTPNAARGAGPGPGAAVDRGALLELFLSDPRQLFDSMDPAPFRERDLDPKAADYIVDWARETPAGQPLRLLVHLGRESAAADDALLLGDAVHEYFRGRAAAARARLRQLFRVGRISLVIGVAFLSVAFGLGELFAGMIGNGRYVSLVNESLVIGGWVALWRPMEIFLYDWWPIGSEARLYDRLSTIELSVRAGALPARQAA